MTKPFEVLDCATEIEDINLTNFRGESTTIALRRRVILLDGKGNELTVADRLNGLHPSGYWLQFYKGDIIQNSQNQPYDLPRGEPFWCPVCDSWVPRTGVRYVGGRIFGIDNEQSMDERRSQATMAALGETGIPRSGNIATEDRECEECHYQYKWIGGKNHQTIGFVEYVTDSPRSYHEYCTWAAIVREARILWKDPGAIPFFNSGKEGKNVVRPFSDWMEESGEYPLQLEAIRKMEREGKL